MGVTACAVDKGEWGMDNEFEKKKWRIFNFNLRN